MGESVMFRGMVGIGTIVLLFAAVGPVARATVLATGIVTDVKLGYVWLGSWAGVQSTSGGLGISLEVTLDSGASWKSCFEPLDCSTCTFGYNNFGNPTQSAIPTIPGVAPPTVDPRHTFAVPGYIGLSPDGSNKGVAALGVPSSAMQSSQNVLLVMLSMAALKGLPVEISRPGWKPPFLPATCFDTVRVCFSGSCD